MRYKWERVEDKKNQCHFAMGSLCDSTVSHCNGCVAFKKAKEKKKKKKNE